MQLIHILVFTLFLSFSLASQTLSTEEGQALLLKHKPVLFTTFKEFSPPVGIESMVENGYLIDERTSNILAGKESTLSLKDLEKYNEEHITLKLKKDYTELYGESKKENYRNSKPVVYGRYVDIPKENMIALQYFFFYPGSYTGKLLIPMQMKWHEGDTEFAQIILNRKTRKIAGASTSIHYYGKSLPKENLLYGQNGRVKMYVAQHSHATYMSPAKGRGHQAMVGNLGFGGDLIVSLKTVWDPAREEQEVNYQLIIPEENSLVFRWKGRWGGKEDILPGTKGAKNREMGPRSFAYRNALSEKLSMFDDPAGYFYFYYHPTAFYQRLVMSLKKIENEEVLEEMFGLLKRIGRLRAKVDANLKARKDLNPLSRIVLAEAVPFVVFAARQAYVQKLYEGASAVMGKENFLDLADDIAKKQLKIMVKHLDGVEELRNKFIKKPLQLFLLNTRQLSKILGILTGLSQDEIFEFYRGSHMHTIGDQLYDREL